jgi:hypothetical protein
MSEFPIFDADGMAHFPCGDPCLLCERGRPICWDCQLPWPCPPAVEIGATREVSGV